VAATAGIIRSHLDGVEALAASLDAAVSETPRELDEDRVRSVSRALEEDEDLAGWSWWYMVETTSARRLVGVALYKGRPSEDGTVELGYVVLPADRGKGYATEAVRALATRAFDDDAVRAVLAHADPDATASLKVLNKCGFACVGAGSPPGALRYALLRHWAADPDG